MTFNDIVNKEDYVYEDGLFFAIFDRFPVSPGHLLIISKRLAMDYFELTENEKAGLSRAICAGKKIIEGKHSPDGYNIGMNCGESAGQTIFHFHCHLIPRYRGDTVNPRGGVRHCIPGKGYY